MHATSTTGLAARLKAETRELHREAERSGVMAELLKGQVSPPHYRALLVSLQALYAALEAGLDCHPPEHRLWRPELRRLPALERDLQSLPTEGATAALPATTQRYVARLQHLTQQAPQLLLAHAYLRYLGDLHGGQVLARLVRQQPGLATAGTAFYDFGPPAQVQALVQDFRAGLDALALSPEQATALVDEACEAFRLHQQLFRELQALPAAAAPTGASA
ncbi:MAG: biliverdin-producing heme oxygenase [Roseateles sp.]|nr:MAG: biliverdin-producing heme oxygenase [Roseateles sp.]